MLVLDPSEIVRRRLRELLSEQGALDVVDTGDPERALELVSTGRIEVVLLDIAIGVSARFDRSGLGLLSEIRRLAAAAKLVVLTNHSSEAHRHACRTHGADYFFDKSRDFERAARVTLGLARGFGSRAAEDE